MTTMPSGQAAEMLQGSEVYVKAILTYPGSRVSDVYVNDTKLTVPNFNIRFPEEESEIKPGVWYEIHSTQTLVSGILNKPMAKTPTEVLLRSETYGVVIGFITDFSDELYITAPGYNGTGFKWTHWALIPKFGN
jgi:hypothetical protein